MLVDFPGLQAFLSIAERGSFNRAASHLNLSQTALSHRIKKLEESLGTELFTRTTRHVALSAAGAELLPKARKLIEEMELALGAIKAGAVKADERLAIGCLPTIAMHCLPKAMARFKQTHSQTTVKIYDNSAAQIADYVHSGDAEFGITMVAANRWDLELKPLKKEPFVLVCHKDLPLAGQTSVTWAQIDGLPLIRISAEAGNRTLIDEGLGGRKDNFSWGYEVQRVTTAVSMVSAGVGYAIVPKLAFDVSNEPDIVAIALKSPSVHRTLGVITRKGVPLSGAGKAMLGFITDALRESVG